MMGKCNMLNPIVFEKTNFSSIDFTSFNFAAYNKERIDLPLKIEFREVSITNVISILNSLIIVKTNSKFFMYDSYVNNIFNVKRGGLVLADYKESYVFIKNTTLI